MLTYARYDKSGPRPNRHLLAEMCDGPYFFRESGSRRGELHGELRGSVHGCEYDGIEAFGGVEGAGRCLSVGQGSEGVRRCMNKADSRESSDRLVQR